MQDFKNFLCVLAIFIVGMLVIVASAGCINYGVTTHQHLYTVAGCLNFGWLVLVVKKAIEFINNMKHTDKDPYLK